MKLLPNMNSTPQRSNQSKQLLCQPRISGPSIGHRIRRSLLSALWRQDCSLRHALHSWTRFGHCSRKAIPTYSILSRYRGCFSQGNVHNREERKPSLESSTPEPFNHRCCPGSCEVTGNGGEQTLRYPRSNPLTNCQCDP